MLLVAYVTSFAPVNFVECVDGWQKELFYKHTSGGRFSSGIMEFIYVGF